ncbi:MAG TPA: PadR family transcriptional regulator [Vicinamibacterales bacterium]|jgi:PadR family transcriptional regulator, regulatory protein PadR|nr:PadR family transcriptional regulator [Vicinamibacterales bacterium]
MSSRLARPPRLSAKETLIVELLLRDEELYGLQLVAASRGRLKRGTVYVTLGRMEDKGFITAREEAPPPEEGGLPRRVYRVTSLGRHVYEAWNAAALHLASLRLVR